MKKQQTVADRIRTMLENEVVELSEKRSLIDTELQTIVKMLGVVTPKPKKRWKKQPTGQVALQLLAKHDEVTPSMLAEQARVSDAAASAALAYLVDNKKAKRVRRGVFSK